MADVAENISELSFEVWQSFVGKQLNEFGDKRSVLNDLSCWYFFGTEVGYEPTSIFTDLSIWAAQVGMQTVQ